MKLAKLFLCAVLAVVAMAFVACEPDTPNTPKEYALEITSDAVMEFPAEGGDGNIAWRFNEVTRNSPVPQPEPTFATEAEWIVLSARHLGAFEVYPNEGEAREAVITVVYGEQVETVTIKQAAPTQEPEPTPVETIELAYAVRLSSEEIGVENNIFAIMFADDAESVEVGIMLVGKKGVEVLEEGLYNAYNGSFMVEESGFQTYVDGEIEAGYIIEDGEVEVSLDGEIYTFDIAVTTSDGYEFNFVYTGVVEGMVQEPEVVEPVAFTPTCVKAERYMIGNFFLQLYIDDTRYHELDMYDEVAPNDDYLTAGVYSYAAETISTWSTFSTGNDQTCAFADAEITLTHNEDFTTTVVGYIKSEEGDYITIDWTGVIEGFVFQKETGKIFTVEALSAKVEYDKEGQKDILFMVDEFAGHKFSFKGEALLPGKPLADGEYSSEAATIDINYCVHGYGDGYGDMTSRRAQQPSTSSGSSRVMYISWRGVALWRVSPTRMLLRLCPSTSSPYMLRWCA